MREKLENDRAGVIQHFKILSREEQPNGEVGIKETSGYIQAGEYPDGRLGEVFIRVGKPGSSEALLDQFAVAASIALQHGAGVEELFGKFTHTSFEPSGAVKGVDGIERCLSVLDLVARYLIGKYGRTAA